MGTIKDEAINNQEKSKIKNISELQFVDINSTILKDDKSEWPYMYIEVAGVRYKITKSVLSSLNAILEDNPDLKSFKVKRTGTTKDDTKYIVIPLN